MPDNDIVTETVTVSHDGKQFLIRLPHKIADILYNLDDDQDYVAELTVDVQELHDTGERTATLTIKEHDQHDE